jgi:calcineurin-like phosphoesterase family protein
MRRFLIADHHIGHENICKFTGVNGTKLRPFNNADEMDEALIENHNKVVRPQDTTYFLGDVAIAKKNLVKLARMNGRKILVRGNHDIFRIEEYLPYFEDIRGSHKLGNFILSHVPIHPDSVARWATGNIHGHLHDGRVMLNGEIDRRYICVSGEHTNFAPVDIEEIEDYR